MSVDVDGSASQGAARASGLTRLMALGSEAAWSYLILVSLTLGIAGGVYFSPLAVLVPLGAPFLAFPLVMWLRDRGQAAAALLFHRGRAGSGAGATAHPLEPAVDAFIGVLAALVYLLAASVSVLGLAWWELFRARYAFGADLWTVAVAEGRLSSEFGAPLALLVFGSALLWWRGTVLSSGGLEASSLLKRFAWGSGALLVLAGLTDGTGLDSSFICGLIGIYLACSIVALSSSRLDAAGSGRASPGARTWLSALAFALLLGGFGFAYWMLPLLVEPVRATWDWVTGVVVPAAAWVLGWIAHLLGLDQAPLPLPADPSAGALPGGGEKRIFSLPEELRDAGRLFFNLSWIVMGLYAIVTTVMRLLRRGGELAGRGGTRERLPWSVRLGLRQAAFALVLGLVRRWPALLRFLRRATAAEQAGTARELYRWLLAWSGSRGVRPKPWTTPRELRRVLDAGWPHLAGDFDLLTESYLRARYGGASVIERDLDDVIASWGRIAHDRSPAAKS